MPRVISWREVSKDYLQFFKQYLLCSYFEKEKIGIEQRKIIFSFFVILRLKIVLTGYRPLFDTSDFLWFKMMIYIKTLAYLIS